MIDRVRLASVWVSDQERAFDFYVNKLGFAVQADIRQPDGYRWLEVVPPGAQTALTLAKPDPDQAGSKIGGLQNIIFATGDMQTTFQELSTKGVRFVELPAKQDYGVIQAVFADPDGNTFLLVEKDD